jgi:hypothetical protein
MFAKRFRNLKQFQKNGNGLLDIVVDAFSNTPKLGWNKSRGKSVVRVIANKIGCDYFVSNLISV